MNYTYDSGHRVKTRTDAKGQQVQYDYDSYERVTQVRRYAYVYGPELINQRVSYSYDTNPLAPGFSQNSSGQADRGDICQ